MPPDGVRYSTVRSTRNAWNSREVPPWKRRDRKGKESPRGAEWLRFMPTSADGECGFCFRWVHLWKNVVEPRGFALKDLRSASADGILQISPENLLNDILVLTPSGNSESGADAYLFVARQIWCAWPFYELFSLPGFNWMLWRGYRRFNRNRYRVSRYCPLPGQATAGRAPKDST
jgi:predicted DCC family thiol-disulfide oxidoreductase YuxK